MAVQQIDQVDSGIIATALESKKRPNSKSAMPGPQTVALLEGWNGSVPKSQPCLAHELIGKQYHAQPFAPSVYSWDGELTYNQLDRLSSRLAARLIHHGVRPESFVLVMQEKCKWTAVTLLAVMRAGGAFVMIDCSHPLQRIQQICDQTKPRVVVSSKNTKDMAQKVGAATVISVGDENLSESDMGETATQEPTLVGPQNALYAVCTSGSTGKPKTVVVEHAAFCSMALATGPGYGLTSQTRTFQYVSHAFDVCILDYLTTWIWGGCVCIPSEANREDLARGIIATQANHIHLTPSVARLLNPSDVPCVKSIVLGGEPWTLRDLDQWQGKATLAIGYGPAECAINSCVRNISEREGGPPLHPTNIGPAVGCIGWVVDETDHNQLVDVGYIGELLIEGPNLARGYLNDPEKTDAAFIEDPSWLKYFRLRDKAPHRLYKTGDLVTQQQLDGSFQFVGRKDSQVKLNGQRIELAEVEHHVQRCLSVANEVVVDMVTVMGEKHSRSALVAFVKPHDRLVISDNNDDDSLFISTHPTLRVDIDAATTRLRNEIPNYLIPTAFLILRHVPLSSSGKTDRRRLCQAASALSWRELQGSRAMANISRQPSTELETTLQHYCASVLNEERPENIGMDDNLSHLGMDSLTAIQLVIKCRQDDLVISVRDILTYQTIARLAPHVKGSRVLGTTSQKTTRQPLDLSLYQDTFQRRVMGNVAIDGLEMTAAYPCSPMQRGILLSQARNPKLYENLVVWEIKPRDSSTLVDINRLQDSWRLIVERHQLLRTIFVEPAAHDTSHIQVVYHRCPENTISIDTRHREIILGAFQPSTLERRRSQTPWPWQVTLCPTSNGSVLCHLQISHALVDGMSLSILTRDLQRAYDKREVTKDGYCYGDYITYFQEQPLDTMREYWRKELKGFQPCLFPRSNHRLSGCLDSINTIDIAMPAIVELHAFCENNGVTLFNLFQVAWALVLRSYVGMDSVCFGYLASSRDVPIPGTADIIGPFIDIIPCRFKFQDSASKISQLLEEARDSFIRSLPHRHCGLSEIMHSLDLSRQALFNSIITFQRKYPAEPSGLIFSMIDQSQPTEFDIVLNFTMDDEYITASLEHWSSALPNSIATSVASTFRQVLLDIVTHKDGLVRDLSIISVQDQHIISAWNSELPFPSNSCLHDMVLRQCIGSPDQLAVYTRHGCLTYADLYAISTRVSSRLSQLGVGPNVMVPICMEKSMWVVVSMLSVLLAGGSCVPIDACYPIERIRSVVSQIHPRILIASPSTSNLELNLPLEHIVVLPSISLSDLFSQPVIPPAEVTSSDPAFILFTSGSTGTPKGIILEHQNLCTSIQEQGKYLCLSPGTRTLQFSSYAFDVSVYEIFSTLVHGGCVCVPSEEDRLNNLAGFVSEGNVNWACFTPSLARTLEPMDLPSIKTLVLAGEQVTEEVAHLWASSTNLFNAYGPAECTICTVCQISGAEWEPGTIGHMIGSRSWIVDSTDANKLMPIGSVGELLIEGPVVSRGYLNRAQETQAAYIATPSWFEGLAMALSGRVYKTGDLVQYNADGTLRYIRRKDRQVKIRGQRIELEEIECYLRRFLVDRGDGVVDIISHSDKTKGELLAGFVCVQANGTDGDRLVKPNTPEFQLLALDIRSHLLTSLPRYMVPDIFYSITKIPLSHTGKSDRRRLLQEAQSTPVEILKSYMAENRTIKRPPSTKIEKKVQVACARILCVDPKDIGMDDNMLSLGLDSIRAMKLVSFARSDGLHFTTADVFRSPSLHALAECATLSAQNDFRNSCKSKQATASSSGQDFIRDAISNSLPLNNEIIETVPATELQAEMFGQPPNYWLLSLSGSIDSSNLQKACNILLQTHSILRTIFVQERDNFMQVILKQTTLSFTKLNVPENTSLLQYAQSFCLRDLHGLSPNITPFAQFTLVTSCNTNNLLIIRLSRAHHDALSMPILVNCLLDAYHGKSADVGTDFATYVQDCFCQRTPTAFSFWREVLLGSSMTTFSTPNGILKSSDKSPSTVTFETRVLVARPPAGFTIATVVKAAWALVLANSTRCKDVVFGQLVSGRSTIGEGVIGPCINIIPVRAVIKDSWRVRDLLSSVQTQHFQSMAAEMLGLRDIIKTCTGWSPGVNFGSIVDHQYESEEMQFSTDGITCRLLRYLPELEPSKAIWVVSHSTRVKLKVLLSTSSETLSQVLIEAIGDELHQCLLFLMNHPDQLVADIFKSF